MGRLERAMDGLVRRAPWREPEDATAQAGEPIAGGLERRLRALLHDEERLLGELRRIPPVDRAPAWLALVRLRGATRGGALTQLAWGQLPPAIPRPRIVVAPPVVDGDRRPPELFDAGALAQLVVTSARFPDALDAFAATCVAQRPHVVLAARSLLDGRAQPQLDRLRRIGRVGAGAALHAVVERQAHLLRHADRAHGRDGAGPAAPEDVAHALDARGRGEPLPDELRRELERRLGADLRGVRVHTDAVAARAARAIGARAFTVGSDVYFADGAYATATPDGIQLLLHELTHVVQSQRGQVRTGGGLAVSQPDDPLEREAEATAARLVSGGDARLDPTATRPAAATATATTTTTTTTGTHGALILRAGPGDAGDEAHALDHGDYHLQLWPAAVGKTRMGQVVHRTHGMTATLHWTHPRDGRIPDIRVIGATSGPYHMSVESDVDVDVVVRLEVAQWVVDAATVAGDFHHAFRFHGGARFVLPNNVAAATGKALPALFAYRISPRLPVREGLGEMVKPRLLGADLPPEAKRPRRPGPGPVFRSEDEYDHWAESHPTDRWADILTREGAHVPILLDDERLARMADKVRRGRSDFDFLAGSFPGGQVVAVHLDGTKLVSLAVLADLYHRTVADALKGREGSLPECEVFRMPEGRLYGRRELGHSDAMARWSQMRDAARNPYAAPGDAITVENGQIFRRPVKFEALRVRGDAGDLHTVLPTTLRSEQSQRKLEGDLASYDPVGDDLDAALPPHLTSQQIDRGLQTLRRRERDVRDGRDNPLDAGRIKERIAELLRRKADLGQLDDQERELVRAELAGLEDCYRMMVELDRKHLPPSLARTLTESALGVLALSGDGVKHPEADYKALAALLAEHGTTEAALRRDTAKLERDFRGVALVTSAAALDGFDRLLDEQRRRYSDREQVRALQRSVAATGARVEYQPLNRVVNEMGIHRKARAEIDARLRALGPTHPLLALPDFPVEELAFTDDEDQARALLLGYMNDRKSDVAKARAKLAADPELVFKLRGIVGVTCRELGVKDGSITDLVVQHRAAEIQRAEDEIAALVLVITVILSVLSGGTAAAVVIPAVILSTGIGVWQAVQQLNEYMAAKHFAGAQLITADEVPWIGWVVVGFIAAGMNLAELGPAIQLLKTSGPASKAIRAFAEEGRDAARLERELAAINLPEPVRQAVRRAAAEESAFQKAAPKLGSANALASIGAKAKAEATALATYGYLLLRRTVKRVLSFDDFVRELQRAGLVGEKVSAKQMPGLKKAFAEAVRIEKEGVIDLARLQQRAALNGTKIKYSSTEIENVAAAGRIQGRNLADIEDVLIAGNRMERPATMDELVAHLEKSERPTRLHEVELELRQQRLKNCEADVRDADFKLGDRKKAEARLAEETASMKAHMKLTGGGPGQWQNEITDGSNMSKAAAAYQSKGSSHSAGQGYYVNGTQFDDWQGGALIDYKYFTEEGRFVRGYRNASQNKLGDIHWMMEKCEDLVAEAKRQKVAASGTPIELADIAQRKLASANGIPVVWRVASKDAKEAIDLVFKNRGVTGIKVVVWP